MLLIVLLWVALSGIGGFTFQNTDFHSRNAIFRDLINYDWPVRYSANAEDSSISYSLTYYIGFWLPAALVGKLTNWVVANIVLYIWAVIGIILVLFNLISSHKSRPIYFMILLVFFSGMDALGSFIQWIRFGKISPLLWPPFMHLEWWILSFQFSSFTTQLFWVFNQAIPIWLCLAVLYSHVDRKTLILYWSLGAFFSPLPAIGMFPYIILKIPRELFNPENIKEKVHSQFPKSISMRLVNDIRSILTSENLIGGGIVILITFLYLSSNINSSSIKFNVLSPYDYAFWIFFIIFEALFLWSLFLSKYKKNLNWYLAGFLILVIPMITVGNANDFSMRASIPTLFMLMIWSAETLVSPTFKFRTMLIVVLCIGAVTPIYEINRSIYRTSDYLLNPPSQTERIIGSQVKIYDIESFEYDHPYTLTADSFKSLANIKPETIPTYLAISDRSFFFTYLAK